MSTATSERTPTSNDTRSEDERGGSGDASTSMPERNVKYGGITALRNFIRVRRIDLAMWVLRLITLWFTIFSIIPIFGYSGLFTRRALLANAATSALRLHQRLTSPITISLEFFARLITEDACHYLLFSLIFLFFGNISFALIPIAMFSSLHVASFTLQMMEAAKGPSVRMSAFGYFLHVWTFKTAWILRMAATSELALMGVICMNCIRGNASILMPFAYYRFLTFRYASRRNNATRTVMREIRMALEQFMTSGSCPRLLQMIIRKIITILCKLAPAVPPTPSS